MQPVSAIRGEGAVRVREAADKEERELEDGLKAGGSGGAGVRGSEKGLGKRVVCVGSWVKGSQVRTWKGLG